MVERRRHSTVQPAPALSTMTRTHGGDPKDEWSSRMNVLRFCWLDSLNVRDQFPRNGAARIWSENCIQSFPRRHYLKSLQHWNNPEATAFQPRSDELAIAARGQDHRRSRTRPGIRCGTLLILAIDGSAHRVRFPRYEVVGGTHYSTRVYARSGSYTRDSVLLAPAP
jgi:hypothetical protein